MIRINCTHCKAQLSIDEAFAGGVCRCQFCGTIQTVPKHLKGAENMQAVAAGVGAWAIKDALSDQEANQAIRAMSSGLGCDRGHRRGKRICPTPGSRPAGPEAFRRAGRPGGTGQGAPQTDSDSRGQCGIVIIMMLGVVIGLLVKSVAGGTAVAREKANR